jgi:VWFA-related protein
MKTVCVPVLPPLTILALLLAMGVSRPAPALQQDVPEFPSRVELVTVDVVVTDSEGRPVGGLDADDFVLSEDGVPQTLSTFEAIALPDQPTTPRRTVESRSVSTNVPAETEAPAGRWFGLVLDDLHLELREMRYAKDAVTTFLETGVREGDRVTLATTSGDVWWTARMPAGRDEMVGLLEHVAAREPPSNGPDWISPYEAQRIWVYSDGQVQDYVERRLSSNGILRPDIILKSRVQEVYHESVEQSRRALEVLERVLRPLEEAERPGALILLSGGFVYDSRATGFRRVLEASRRSNMPLHFVDARALMAMPAVFGADERGSSFPGMPQFWALDVPGASGEPEPEKMTGLEADRLERLHGASGPESLALDSGGLLVHKTNDPTKGLEGIAESSRVYYFLGYHPTNAARDGSYRTIEVKLKKKGLEVRARKGYRAPLEGEPTRAGEETDDPWYQAALDSPLPVTDIPLRVASYVFEEARPGRARTVLATEVDVHDLGRQTPKGSRDVLDVLLLVGDPAQGEFMREDVTAGLTTDPQTRRELEAKGLPVLRELDLTPGAFKARVVVRDRGTGRIGSVDHRFEVPALGGLRVSSLVITDALEPKPDWTMSQLEPRVVAHRVFPTGSLLFVHYEVYGAVGDPATGRPRVRTGLEVRERHGALLGGGELVALAPSPEGRLSRTSEVRLAQAPPGDYEMVLRVRDDLAGQERVVREGFALVGPDTPE